MPSCPTANAACLVQTHTHTHTHTHEPMSENTDGQTETYMHKTTSSSFPAVMSPPRCQCCKVFVSTAQNATKCSIRCSHTICSLFTEVVCFHGESIRHPVSTQNAFNVSQLQPSLFTHNLFSCSLKSGVVHTETAHHLVFTQDVYSV